MSEATDIGSLIQRETEKRLAEMAERDYEFPPKAGAWNWWAIVSSVAVSIVLIVLCMAGVIR